MRLPLVLLLACAPAPERAFVVLESEQPLPADSVHASPPHLLLGATATAGRLVLTVALGRAAELRLTPAGGCPVTISLGQLRAGQIEHRAVTPAYTFQAPAGAVGFDAPVAVTATRQCEAGPLSWRQLAGPPLRELHTDGERLTGRTAPRQTLLPAIPWGVVPVSARAAGEVTIEARWRGGRRAIVLAAAHRSRGLPNSTPGRLLLGGDGWHVTAPPAGGHARVELQQGLATLLPDVPGQWGLTDGQGRSLLIHTGRYDETLLDCGRSGCHAEITRAAAGSPMTVALARLLAARPPVDDPACALACHTTGDLTLADGGFSDLARTLGVTPQTWPELPPALRREGGVGCLACHGPGAIPAPSARWSILRAGVCATCHDAPPRYGHVASWQVSRMAAADADPHTREAPCARCHTSWGFLASLRPGADRRPPDEAGALGIGCAACHAVHGDALAPGLLRRFPAAVPAGTERSAICLGCHQPDDSRGAQASFARRSPVAGGVGDPARVPITTDRPYASAGALWLGRGGVDPASGRPLPGPAPHAAIADGCLACHAGADAPPVQRGRGHTFRAARDGCRRCHPAALVESTFAAGEELRVTAERLLAGLGARPGPHHPVRLDRNTAAGRAGWNLLLLLEDRGAAAHNPVYARTLMASAQSALRDPPR